MKIYDITRELCTAPLYPGSAPSRVTQVLDMAAGDYCNVTRMEMSSHAATHCDAPAHFIPGGADTAQVDAAVFCGPCRVLTAPAARIDAAWLRAALDSVPPRLLLHTGGTGFLTPDAAEFLTDAGVIAVGTDGLSVSSNEDETAVHFPLLNAGVGIIEQLWLEEVPDGDYFLSAAPLKVSGAEGAPCRALLFDGIALCD